MTMEDTRRDGRRGTDRRTAASGPAASAPSTRPGGRSTSVVRPDEEQPLGNISGRVREGVGGWLRSPALDFYGLLVVGALLIGVGL